MSESQENPSLPSSNSSANTPVREVYIYSVTSPFAPPANSAPTISARTVPENSVHSSESEPTSPTINTDPVYITAQQQFSRTSHNQSHKTSMRTIIIASTTAAVISLTTVIAVILFFLPYNPIQLGHIVDPSFNPCTLSEEQLAAHGLSHYEKNVLLIQPIVIESNTDNSIFSRIKQYSYCNFSSEILLADNELSAILIGVQWFKLNPLPSANDFRTQWQKFSTQDAKKTGNTVEFSTTTLNNITVLVEHSPIKKLGNFLISLDSCTIDIPDTLQITASWQRNEPCCPILHNFVSRLLI